MPFMISKEKADIATVMGTHPPALEYKKRLFKDEQVQIVLKHLLPEFDKKGLLDRSS